jgi:hypothetical protein
MTDQLIYVRKFLHNEGNLAIDITAAAEYVGGLTNGYIQFEISEIQFTGNNYILLIGDENLTTILLIRNWNSTEDMINFLIAPLSTKVLEARYTRPASGVVKFSFSESGHSLTIDGQATTLSYDIGDASTPVWIPTNDVSFDWVFNYRQIGYCDNLEIGNQTSPVLKYQSYSTNEKDYIELIQGAHGEYTTPPYITKDKLWDIIGYNPAPQFVYNKQPPEKNPSPFVPLALDLSTIPTNDDRAYLRRVDTNQPIITNGDWTGIGGITNIKRNSLCWYYKKAMTCFTVFSTNNSFAGHATLISPRHAIMSTHIFDDPTGRLMYWMDMNDNYEERDYIDSISFPWLEEDVTVMLLDSAVTLDVSFATFMTDIDSDNFDVRDVRGCGPSREGYFSIENIGQMCSIGIPADYENAPEYKWSRWDNPQGDRGRFGDSSSPYFFYNDDTLFLAGIIRSSQSTYPYMASGVQVYNNTFRGLCGTYMKRLLQAAMNTLDERNGITEHYSLIESEI